MLRHKTVVHQVLVCEEMKRIRFTKILEFKSSINLPSPYSGENPYVFSYILKACLILEPLESTIDFPCFASYVIWLYFTEFNKIYLIKSDDFFIGTKLVLIVQIG